MSLHRLERSNPSCLQILEYLESDPEQSRLRLLVSPKFASGCLAIISYHQQLLEHTNADEELDYLEIVSKWVHLHLGPWP
jgi:hypothetical protein